MNTNTPTLEQLKRGLAIAEKIAALEAELTATFGNKAVPAPPTKAVAQKSAVQSKRRRKFSAQALANIRAAQKRRWAKVDAKPVSPEPAKAKRKLSPKAVANIRAAQKKRWANVNSKKVPTKAASPQAKAKTAAKASSKKSRKVSPAIHAKLPAAMKTRSASGKKTGGPLPTGKK